jgi:hypothetical protein
MTGASQSFMTVANGTQKRFMTLPGQTHFTRGVERLDAEVAVTRKEWIQKENSDGPEEEEGSIERPTFSLTALE